MIKKGLFSYSLAYGRNTEIYRKFFNSTSEMHNYIALENYNNNKITAQYSVFILFLFYGHRYYVLN